MVGSMYSKWGGQGAGAVWKYGSKGLLKASPYLGLAGLGVGAGVGAVGYGSNEMDPGTGAAVGAGIGAASAIALPALAVGATGLGVGLTGGAANLGVSGTWGVMSSSLPYKAGTGLASFAGATAAVGGLQAMNAISNIGSSMMKYVPGVEGIKGPDGKITGAQRGKLRPTAIGWGVLGIGAAISVGRSSLEASNQIRMGNQRDNYITRATPRIPAYKDNAGASGDLVFALNSNRQG